MLIVSKSLRCRSSSFYRKAAATRIAKLPWVASARVERHLPNAVSVHVTERVPLARWQRDQHIVVIDGEGHTLLQAKPDDFSTLPLVVGAGAAAGRAAFTNLVTFLSDDTRQT